MSWIICLLVLVVAVVGGFPAEWSRICDARPNTGSENRIVGGSRASISEFPHQLRLKDWPCGAILVKADFALTSANCVVSDVDLEGLEVIGGDLDVCLEEETEQVRKVSQVIPHPDYDGYQNDLAILKLDSPFVLSEAVKPIEIAPEGYEVKGQAVVTGWGSTGIGEDASAFSRFLRKVQIPTIPDDTCEAIYHPYFVPAIMLCSGAPRRGTCDGDEGGALISAKGTLGTNDMDPILIGITSFHGFCSRDGFPGVYTEVAHFHRWIKSIIQE